MWDLYQRHPSFVLGFHGCDEATGEKLLSSQGAHLTPSTNKYDWLGEGIYFWESNPLRAQQFAEEARMDHKLSRGRIARPFVVGAVIDLCHCLNLFDSKGLLELTEGYKSLKAAHRKRGTPLPKNTGQDFGARFLDQAVIEAVHVMRRMAGMQPYDTVRSGFSEGGRAYPGSGFTKKAHIQIAVRNQSCIKGYFRPIPTEPVPQEAAIGPIV